MDNNKYSSWIQFRVNPEERDLIKEKAKSKNLSLSAFLRFRAISEDSTQSDAPPAQWIINALSTIGNQLNHIESVIDDGQHPDSDSLRILTRSLKKLLKGVQSHDRRL